MQKISFETVLPWDNWQEPGDYFNEEGILFCGKCNTPKMAFVDIPGLFEHKPSPRQCQCARAKAEQEEAEYTRRRALEEIERLRKQGLTSSQYMESDFSMDNMHDKKVTNTCKRYVEKWEQMKAENIGLMLHGNYGGGKTFYASCIANAILYKGEAVLMTTITDLALAMRANFGQDRTIILEHVQKVPLLILDDVGREETTFLDLAYDIVNARYKARKPLIITTNLTMKAIRDETTSRKCRIYDRLIELCVPVRVEDAKQRQEIARNKYDRLQDILDLD